MISTPIAVTNLSKIPSHTHVIFDIPRHEAVRHLDRLIQGNNPDDLSTIKSLIGAGIFPSYRTSMEIEDLVTFVKLSSPPSAPHPEEMPHPPSYGHNITSFENVLKSIYDADLYNSPADEILRDKILKAILDDDALSEVPTILGLHPYLLYRLFRLAAMYLAYEVMDILHNEIVYENLHPHPDDKEALAMILKRMRYIYDSI